MTDHSHIEWTEATWNPVTGCTKISAGCKNGYAERLAMRLRDGEPALPAQWMGDKSASILYSPSVSGVTEIIEAVKRLDERQKGEFLEKLAEIDFEDAWDRQIEADAKAGRLDPLWEQALEDIKAGRVKPLDEVIGDA